MMETHYKGRSAEVDKIAAALCKARLGFKEAVKDGYADIGGGYRYASIESLQRATAEALAQNGVMPTQLFVDDPSLPPGVKMIETLMIHAGSGQFLSSMYRVEPPTKRPHDIGSAITYGKRYSYASMLGIVCDEDDCGVIAQNSGREARPAAVAAPAAEAAPGSWTDAILVECSQARTPAQLEQILGRIDSADVAQAAKNKARMAHNKARLRIAEAKEAA